MDTLGMVIAIAMIVLNIIGIVYLGIKLEHFILVPLAYIIGLIIIGNINENACMIVAFIVAAITLIPVMVKIVKIIINIIKTIIDAIEIKRLQKEEAQRNRDLLDAVNRSDKDVAQKLIENGADVNYIGYINLTNKSLLQIAIENHDKEMISLLIKKGADVNLINDGKTPLDVAEDDEIITILKEHGAKTKAEVDKTKEEFINACLDNNVAYVKNMLEKNKQLANTAKDEHGMTVLIMASINGNKEIVELLISSGADVNMQCEAIQNENALICAAYSGHKEIVELLLANGATINARKSDGMDALMWASSRGYKDVAELLIDKGADVNSKDYEGFSPLMLAAQEGHIHLVEFLINKGAKVNAENYYGGTAIKLAYKGKHFDIVELLERNGARH